MEDYIYILLVLAISVIGAIRQNQKRKRMMQASGDGEEAHPYEKEAIPTSPETHNNKKAHDIWDEFFGVDDDFTEQPVVIREEPVIVQEEKVIKAKEEGERVLFEDQISDEIANSFNEGPMENEENTILEEFDLKKAVIFSEILKPKYL